MVFCTVDTVDSTTNEKIQSQLKYQSSLYNIQRDSDVYNRGIKMRQNNKIFISLNVINGKTSPYASKGILRKYHYRSDTKLGLGIVAITKIPFSCHDCTYILSISWDS